MWTRLFWKQAAERAIKTALQAALTLWAVGNNSAFNIVSVDWGQTLGVSAGMALVSVFTSILSTQIGDTDTPSLVPTTLDRK